MAARRHSLGAVLGLAILGNVRLAALPFVIGAYLLWRSRVSRRTRALGVALLGAAAVVVAPWVVRNRVDVGCWSVTTDARALWKANNIDTYPTLERGGWIDNVTIPSSFPLDPQDIYFHWQKTGVVIPYSECAQMTSYEHKVESVLDPSSRCEGSARPRRPAVAVAADRRRDGIEPGRRLLG